VGIALISPHRVVSRATEMSPARRLGSAEPETFKVPNAPTIPMTVPSSPNIGEAWAMTERKLIQVMILRFSLTVKSAMASSTWSRPRSSVRVASMLGRA